MPGNWSAWGIYTKDLLTNQCNAINMHLHYMLVWVFILERQGGETNNGLTGALNHNAVQIKAVDLGLLQSHGWGDTREGDFADSASKKASEEIPMGRKENTERIGREIRETAPLRNRRAVDDGSRGQSQSILGGKAGSFSRVEVRKKRSGQSH